MGIKKKIKKLLDICLFGRIKRKRTTEYWWSLRESAQKKGLVGFLKKQKHNRLVDHYGAFIPLRVSFAEMPMMPHGISGIFISSGAKIGRNCTIFHQVTIGSNTLKGSKGAGAPTIGNNVYIGCGAKIIGNVTIGDNVRIGANCVITTDIPSNCTVVLEKPRIIMKDNQQNEFVPYSSTDHANGGEA